MILRLSILIAALLLALLVGGCCWNKTVTKYPDGRVVTEYQKKFEP